MSLFVFDLDGTLCNNQHRKDLLPTGDGSTTEQWEAFNKACHADTPIGSTMNFYHTFSQIAGKANLVFVTGRGEHARKETEQWLLDHGIWGHKIYMRPNSDHRKSAEFKLDVFKKIGVNENSVIVEDDPAIVDMAHNVFKCTAIFVPSQCEAVLAQKSQQGCDDSINVPEDAKREGGLVDGLLNAGDEELGLTGDKPAGDESTGKKGLGVRKAGAAGDGGKS